MDDGYMGGYAVIAAAVWRSGWCFVATGLLANRLLRPW